MNKVQYIAILMADLSGYSALTETHGAISAADLIDKYVAIVKGCLVGDSRIMERVGDEVMIVSLSPDIFFLPLLSFLGTLRKRITFSASTEGCIMARCFKEVAAILDRQSTLLHGLLKKPVRVPFGVQVNL